MDIRIIDVPPGEAPERIRRAWIGLALPLAEGETGPRSVRSFGVVSGPRGFFGRVFGLLMGRAEPAYGYVVDSLSAQEILTAHDLQAAEWWRQNSPHCWDQGRKFVFHAEVCQEI